MSYLGFSLSAGTFHSHIPNNGKKNNNINQSIYNHAIVNDIYFPLMSSGMLFGFEIVKLLIAFFWNIPWQRQINISIQKEGII